MGDNDELRLRGEGVDHVAVAAAVRLVERGIGLVEYEERRRVDLTHREDERDRGERALAARELHQGAHLLLRQRDRDLDARTTRLPRAVFGRFFVALCIGLERETRAAAAEHEREVCAEGVVDRREPVGEVARELLVEIADEELEALGRCGEVVELAREEGFARARLPVLAPHVFAGAAGLFEPDTQPLERAAELVLRRTAYRMVGRQRLIRERFETGERADVCLVAIERGREHAELPRTRLEAGEH